MNRPEEIAKNIKQLIKYSGKSAPQLATELKVPKAQIYSYMKGCYLPGAIMIIKLCKALDCTYIDILGPLE